MCLRWEHPDKARVRRSKRCGCCSCVRSDVSTPTRKQTYIHARTHAPFFPSPKKHIHTRPRARAYTHTQVPVNMLSAPTELFQLSRTDFEDVMQKFPIVRTRLAESGQIKQRLRSVKEVQKLDSKDIDDEDDAVAPKKEEQAATGAPAAGKKGIFGKLSSMFKS